uniref:Bestrophin homolog n=1 Tax=Pseudictyota dubia TaxID=2749911 RepID=A0A7R9Z8H1_9STRA
MSGEDESEVAAEAAAASAEIGEESDSNDLKKSKTKELFRKAYAQHRVEKMTKDMLTSLRNSENSPFVMAADEEDDGDGDVPVEKVTYDSDSHLSVLFQMHGSVWPSVLPFCLVNVLITYLVVLAKWNGIDLTFPSDGHTFMAIMVSFLIVTRAQITYHRFMEARGYLSELFRSCRELIHHTAILTMQDKCRGAKQWRKDVAFRTIVLLRVTIAALEFRTSKINTWDVVPTDMRQSMVTFVPDGASPSTPRASSTHRMMKWAHGVRTLSDENFRAPIVMAYNLRAEIMKQRNGQYLKIDMHPNEELKLLAFVSDYIAAFHGLKKLITTPFPFPLVQMARTFLFFWIFTLPFALVREISEPVQAMLIIFFTTFGFIGLEYVSMELDDPFGDDPNDFDDLGMAQMVFEDIYITLYKLDGSASAEDLRKQVANQVKRGGTAVQEYHRDMQESMGSMGNLA